MTPIALNDPKRVIFALVPEKGPLSMRLMVGSPTAMLSALREIHVLVDTHRAGRSTHPVLLDFAPEAMALVQNAHTMGVVIKAMALSGFTPTGILESARAEALSGFSDLMVQPGVDGCTAGALEAYQVVLEEEIRLKEEAAAWDEAVAADQVFEAKKAEEARQERQRQLALLVAAWSEALIEDEQFEKNKAEKARQARAEELAREAALWEEAIAANRAFDARRLAHAWAEALVMDVQFNRAAAERVWDEAVAENALFDGRVLLAAWDEALAEDATFESRQAEDRLVEEAIAWEEALVYDARLNRANAAAHQIREAVLKEMSQEPVRLSLEDMAFAFGPTKNGATEWTLSPVRSSDAEGDVAVLEAPVAVEAKAAEVPVPTFALVHTGRLRSGTQVYAENRDLIVFGHVSSGAEAIADGHVTVNGPMYGRVVAGAQGDTSVHVVCQAFYGEMVSIGGRYTTFDALPEALRGAPVHFWVENDGIHYRRLDLNAG